MNKTRLRPGLRWPRNNVMTAFYLERLDACYEALDKFRKEWPAGMPITRANIIRAADIGLDMIFIAMAVLNEQSRIMFRTEYRVLSAEANRKKLITDRLLEDGKITWAQARRKNRQSERVVDRGLARFIAKRLGIA